MSLVRIKAALVSGAMGIVPPDAVQELYDRMLALLIADTPGETMYTRIPAEVPDIEFRRRQGDLFAQHREAGLTLREIAKREGVSKSSVHRTLSQA